MKRILYIHHGKGIGGAPLSLLYLIRSLDKTKYYPIVLCLYKSKAVDLYRNEGIETYLTSSIKNFSHTTLHWYSLKYFLKLFSRIIWFLPSIINTCKIVKDLRVDLIHLNGASLAPSAIGSKLAGIPVVWHIREPISKGYFGIRKFLLKHCINKLSDRVISICRSDAKRLIKSDKVQIIYNFVDFQEFDRLISGENFRREFKITNQTKTVGMFGGVTEVKGTLEFIKAAKLVQGKIPDVKFFIVGPLFSKMKKGIKQILKRIIKSILGMRNYYEKITKFIKNNNLDQTVIFTGVRHDIPNILASLDLVAFPSIVPHFGRPIIEAGAMAKPVVAFNVDGPNELILDNITGNLAPLKNINRLSKSIIEILNDENRAKKLGEAGCERAKKLFNSEINAKEVFKIY
ncbi:glycosyltransferase family 4 protein, partial [bacterium]|nr:glycosyltransferase family 4 protein [bacterium]